MALRTPNGGGRLPVCGGLVALAYRWPAPHDLSYRCFRRCPTVLPEDLEDINQFFANLIQHNRIGEEIALHHLLPAAFYFSRLQLLGLVACIQVFPGAFDGVPFIVKQVLDLKDHLDVFAAIEAMASARFLRTEPRKLRLPETQHVRLDAREAAYFANPEVELIRDFGRVRFGSRLSHFCGHYTFFHTR